MTASTFKRQRGLYPRRCTRCEVPKAWADFTRKGGATHPLAVSSWCRPCQSQYRRDSPPKLSPSAKARHLESTARSKKKRNDASRARAKRGRAQQWTSAELSIVARSDLGIDEIATMLGRSVSGVIHARRRVREDPRYARLADLGTDVARRADPGVINIAPHYER